MIIPGQFGFNCPSGLREEVFWFVTVRNNDKPWFTSELRTEIRRRDRFLKIVLKSKRESSILRYKQQRNKVNSIKRNAKENFEKNLDTIILENASNSKECWTELFIKKDHISHCHHILY
jgi:hypothetical protein